MHARGSCQKLKLFFSNPSQKNYADNYAKTFSLYVCE